MKNYFTEEYPTQESDHQVAFLCGIVALLFFGVLGIIILIFI